MHLLQFSKPDNPILVIPNNQNYKFNFLIFSSPQLLTLDNPQLGGARIGGFFT